MGSCCAFPMYSAITARPQQVAHAQVHAALLRKRMLPWFDSPAISRRLLLTRPSEPQVAPPSSWRPWLPPYRRPAPKLPLSSLRRQLR